MIRRLIANVGQVLVVIAAVLLPLLIGFFWFVENLPEATADASETDAIVVLTGGSERLSTGLALLDSGKARRLFVSGVNARVEVADLLKVARPAVFPRPMWRILPPASMSVMSRATHSAMPPKPPIGCMPTGSRRCGW